MLKLVVWILYHSGTFKLLKEFSARFQPKKSKGKLAFPFLQKKTAKNVQILLYHRVNDDQDPFFPAVPTDRFEAQMEYLAGHYFTSSLQEVLERLKHDDLPESTVVVTFDDGYRDNYVHAFPILQRFGIPATIFLASGAIGSGKMLWHDRVFRAFRNTTVPRLEQFANVKELALKTVQQKQQAQAHVLQLLWTMPDDERLNCIDSLEKQLSSSSCDSSAHTMLNWDDVLAMSEHGISFGSHTVSHPILSKLSDERMREEIEGSKRVIERKINRPVNAFAYPVGRKQDFSNRAKGILKEAGYQCAVTTIFGVNESGQDLFELRRGTPWQTDIPSFAAQLSWYKFVANG
jgi:peptidoglycan/xylan/chitin deacetylase (PgdA/CDA1 family)